MQKLSILVLSLFLVQCQSRKIVIHNGENTFMASTIRTEHANSEAKGQKFAIATQGIYATKAAQEIFSLGGNAIDAAIAASFTLAVERPHSTGIGGGGFMLFREGKSKKVYAIDFRERAPLTAKSNMFIGAEGVAAPALSQNGILATAVPGLVAGLLEIHQKFGRLSLKKVLSPSIQLARGGFPIYPSLSKALIQKESLLALDAEASKIFLDQNKKALPLGHKLIQKDLAATLERIAKEGRAGFYQGPTAKRLAQFSKKSKGLITKKDLNQYLVKWRKPLVGSYKGTAIFSMPPPSSGGIHVIQFLNMLENDQLNEKKFLSTDSIHLAASALQSAFTDRARYLGDPDFVKIPSAILTSKEYAGARRAQFYPDRARKSFEVDAGVATNFNETTEHTETTHLSIMDENGDTVSTTQTINGYMGASIVVPGTGIVLNNEMDDFTAQVGASNLFGAIGGAPNSIEPGKTPLSSMSPTIVVKDGMSIMSLGAPGGTRIISCVAQTLLNYLEFNLPLFQSVAAVRYHHQWKPDVLDIDPPGPEPLTLQRLQKMGYDVRIAPVPCNVMAVVREDKIFHAVADPRDIGTSAAQ
ncbi:MAG: gamma-glutamyltransferase [Bacteriovorax sp.]